MSSHIPAQNIPDLKLNDEEVSAPSSPKDLKREEIKHVSRAAEHTTEPSKTPKEVDKFEDRIFGPMESGYYTYAKEYHEDNGDAIKSTVQQIADMASENIDSNALDEGLFKLGFEENTRVLMAALDEVSAIHPFIAASVLAFKAVIMLELKRRDNDRKVIALKNKMSDMMSVLLELSNVRDSNHRGPDGVTLQSRMQRLMKNIAKDITACGNVCDAYAKKGIVVKVLKGPIYEGRLAGYAARFSERRKEIILALQLHATLGVDTANRSLSDMHRNVRAVDEKLSTILLFRMLDSPHEKELLRLIDLKGGPKACMASDTILKELSFVNESSDTASALSALGDYGDRSPQQSQSLDYKAFYILRKDLREDVQKTLEKNKIVFERKFDVQKRQIISEIEDAVHREGDRVITAVISGPHDRIIDPDLHILWQEMGWKGLVKARHFILALHDYIVEKIQNQSVVHADHFIESALESVSSAGSSDSTEDLSVSINTEVSATGRMKREQDGWALAYISILRVQPLLEAFDDDATGWISVKEANHFTSSRPKDWSLSRWIAYWAAGWHSTVWTYQNRICAILQTMLETLTSVLHSNRFIVDRYLSDSSLTKIDLLVRSVAPTNTYDPYLDQKMQPYVLEEEMRLEQNLRSVAWEIDDGNTLSLITGPGRIERYIFPLIFLLLRHHLRVIKVACKEVLHAHEFNSATRSLAYIFTAVQERIDTLSAIFKHKNLDVATQLSKFAFGMFNFLSDSTHHQDPSEGNFSHSWWVDNCSPDDIHAGILKYGIFNEFDVALYYDSGPAMADPTASKSSFPSIIGQWSGHCFTSGDYQTESLLEITITSCADDGKFQGLGYEAVDGSFVVSGEIRYGDASDFEVTFTREFPGNMTRSSIVCTGKLDSTTNGINGQWGYDSDRMDYTMRLNQTPAPLYRYRYTRDQLATNPARARWTFACAAILHRVQQRNYSWSFMKQRIAERKRFVYLYTRRDLNWAWYTPLDFLDYGERDELATLELSLSPYDNRLYRLIAKAIVRRICIHHNTFCNACTYTMRDFRMICLTCMSKDFAKQVDLCMSCIDMPVSKDQFDHGPHHPLVKIRHLLQNREKQNLSLNAWSAVDRAKALFPPAAIHLAPNPGASSEEIQAEELGAVTGNDTIENPSKLCVCCNTLVTIPFWICITCNDTIICIDCDAKKRPALISRTSHDERHALVRYQEPETAKESDVRGIENKLVVLENNINERLVRLEKRFADQDVTSEKRFANQDMASEERLERLERKLEKQLSDQEAALNARLDAMESLLRALAAGKVTRQ